MRGQDAVSTAARRLDPAARDAISVGAADVPADGTTGHAGLAIELEIARAAVRGAIEMGCRRRSAAESAHGRRASGDGRLCGT
jgi:hypothetical protein